MNRKCDAGFLIKQIHDALSKRFNDVLKKYDLTISQMYVLKYLRENQNKMVTQKEIEQYLEVSHPTTVGILKRLESKGFIQTEIIKEGRFSKQVVLTEKSNILHKNFQMEHMESEKRLLAPLSPAEREELIVLLQTIYKNLKEEVLC